MLEFRAKRGAGDEQDRRPLPTRKQVRSCGRSGSWQSDRAVDSGPRDYCVANAIARCAGRSLMKRSPGWRRPDTRHWAKNATLILRNRRRRV